MKLMALRAWKEKDKKLVVIRKLNLRFGHDYILITKIDFLTYFLEMHMKLVPSFGYKSKPHSEILLTSPTVTENYFYLSLV